MATDNTSFESGMLRLQQDYVRRLATQIPEFRRYGELLAQGFLPSRDAQNLFRLSHNLAGSGMTFGFPEISDAARSLNRMVGEYMDVDVAEHRNQALRREHVYTELQKFDDVCRTVIMGLRSGKDFIEPALAIVRRAGFLSKRKEEVASFAEVLQKLGYEIVYAHSLKGLEAQIEKADQAFWVIHSSLTDRETARLEEIPSIMGSVPYYILTTQDNFQTQLAALRMGAAGIASVESDMKAVAAEFLGRLNNKGKPLLPVLVIDDDDLTNSFFHHTLNDSGIAVQCARNPKEAYDLLKSKIFALIIINIDMPQCSGWEFARIIRHVIPPVLTPILFTGVHDNVSGDLMSNLPCAYLKKPFAPDDLLNAIDKILQIEAKATAS